MWTDVYTASAAPPVLAIAAVAGSAVALLAGVIVGFVRARRREILAASASAEIGDRKEIPVLVEGTDVVLAGVVRHLPEHAVAVKVSITQTGSESESSGTWSHAWTEIDREIVLAPFVLELRGGQRVLVEPPKNVEVADALDHKVWIERTRRVLSAELVPGERIFARGRLERSDRAVGSHAYRDTEWGWALRPARGQMLLSSEPLGRGLRQRAAFHRRCARLALAVFLATQVTLVWFYARCTGHTEVMVVTGARHDRTTDSDGDSHDSYVIAVRGEGVDVGRDDFARLPEGTHVPVRVGSDRNWELGAAPTIAWGHVALLASAAVAFWLGYASRRRASRPWFRRKVNESGSGRLPDGG